MLCVCIYILTCISLSVCVQKEGKRDKNCSVANEGKKWASSSKNHTCTNDCNIKVAWVVVLVICAVE